MRKLIFSIRISALIVGIATAAPRSVMAAASCGGFYTQNNLITRSGISREILSREVPTVAIATHRGPISAILVNSVTFPKLAPLIDRSLGTLVSYQPMANNDHGIFRLDRTLVDLDAPGHRARGEIHNTGLSWAPLEDYIRFTEGKKKIRIEVTYALTKEEQRTAVLYQKMRRAAIIRVPFSFNGKSVEPGKTNTLENSGEHCFIFCNGSGAFSQVSEIESKILAYRLGSASEILKQPDVQEWMLAVEAALGKANTNEERSISPTIPLKVGIPQSLQPALAQMNQTQKIEFLNWLVGYKISLAYAEMVRNLEVPSDNGYQGIHSPRAVAVLIYDGVSNEREFLSPNYEAKGAFTTWGHKQMQKPTEVFAEAPLAPEALEQVLPLYKPESAQAVAPKKGFFGWLKDLLP